MKMQIRPVFLRRLHCCARTDWHADRTGQGADQGMPCFAVKGARSPPLPPIPLHWSWRLIDGRKCWYAGKTVIPKSALRWPAAEPAQAKVKVAPPVNVVAEKRSDPMNAQARMLDDDSFESRWRARVSTE